MTQTFKILCRTNNETAWTLYGVFTSEREFRAELSNIRACGLQIKRIGGLEKCQSDAPGAYLADGTKIKPQRLHPFYEENETSNDYVSDNGQFGVGA